MKAADRFFEALAGVVDPEEKRKAIGELFIAIFEEVAAELADVGSSPKARSTPTSSSPARRRRGDDQVAPQRRRTARGHGASSSSSRCGCCSKTRSARSARSSGCPRRSSGASPSPDLASPCASSAR